MGIQDFVGSKLVRKTIGALYVNYKYRVHPHVSNIPGTTRTKEIIGKLLEVGVDKVSQDETTNVLDKEWDNLIILDAARHDIYEEEMGVNCGYIYSVGSHSRQFVQNTFEGREADDIIYITANPHVNKNGEMAPLNGELEDKLFEIYEVFNTGWSDKYGTVMPEEMVKTAKSAEKLFPEKRKIIHFMQPHAPLIGAHKDFFGEVQDLDDDRMNLFELADLGKISREEIIDYYSMNLRLAVPHVEELAGLLDGKTVVSADHAELMGEFGIYGHPYGLKSKDLRKVPWHVISDE